MGGWWTGQNSVGAARHYGSLTPIPHIFNRLICGHFEISVVSWSANMFHSVRLKDEGVVHISWSPGSVKQLTDRNPNFS